MEAEGAYSLGSEEVINLNCDPCKHDGHDIEAMGFCVNCYEFLCGMCCKYHTKPLPSRDHTILNKEDMPKKKPLKPSINVEGKESTADNVFDECLKHEGEYLKYYCGDHTDFGCTVCMTIGHRACEHVKYIPEVAKTFKDTAEFKQFEQMLIHLTAIAREHVDKVKSNATELERSYNETKEQIEEFRMKINERLDQLQNEIKLQADKLMQECTDKMNQVEKDVFEVAEQTANLKLDVDSLVQTGQNVKLFMKMKLSNDEAKMLGTMVNRTRHKITKMEVQFKPEFKLQEIVDDLQSFGNCRKKMSHAGFTSTYMYLSDFSVRSSSDKNLCNIIDLVMLSDKLLVLADNANDKVKVLDIKSGAVLLEHAIPTIRAITRMDVNQVAVSYQCTVQLFSISKSSITSGIEICINDCHSLSFLQTKQYMMVMQCKKHISVIDLKGKVVKIIIPSLTFGNGSCITNSTDDQTVYITDMANNRVCSYTIDGDKKDVYTADTLQEPRGIAVAENEIVYVCGYKSNSIHALLPDNATMKLVLDSTNGIKLPTSIAVNDFDVEQQIIVGFKNSDVIKVFGY